MPAKHTFYYTCVGVIINWVIFQQFHALLTCTGVVGFNHTEVSHVFRECFHVLSVTWWPFFPPFWYKFVILLFPICVCVHFSSAYQNFCRRAEFQSCISCVCPLAIVCVHQAKCWPRMKGLFPSGFNESVCCLLTKRPTPIHLDFLHVFFLLFVFFFFAQLICKEPSIYQMCPLNELVLV